MIYNNPLFSVESLVMPFKERMGKRMPKRMPNKYNVFFAETMAELKSELPDLKHRERMALVAELWRIRKAEASVCE